MVFPGDQVRRVRDLSLSWFTIDLDVVKALCLGARAVGLGRAFLYAQSVSFILML